MKEKLKNKKVVYTIIGILSVLLLALAVTYAYWLVTKTQTGENEITAGCLDITISGEKNDIELTNQFPMSDEEGMKLVPYEFTVTNNCNTSVDYQVALEAIGDSSNALSATSLKVALNNNTMLLSNRGELETTISGSYESRSIGYGTLTATGSNGSSATYSLRIWIDKDAPISEMNKTFKSRISVTIGQGIESPYEEGTLAYDILANYGGVNAASEIDASELDHRITATGNINISTSSNYYYGTEYTFDETTKKYTLSGTLTQASLAECRNGTNTCGKYTLRNTSSTYSSTTLYEVTDFQSSGNKVTANTWGYVNAFSKVTDSSEAGLYKTQDDLGDSYYFRGAPSNNYVQFGKWSENWYRYEGCHDYGDGEECYGEYYPSLEACEAVKEDYMYSSCKKANTLVSQGDLMYWRIVRINGDGTIRLVYDGTTKAQNGVSHASNVGYSAFNSNYDNAKYVGYTYEGTNEAGETVQVDSTIKGALDTWYDTHLEANYGDKIADSIFCNDRSSRTTDSGYIYYGAYDRLEIINNIPTPSLKCPNQSDRYTVDDTANGNGLLSNPVGLITADEEVLAGNSANKTNTSYYLYNGERYWTSAPNHWISSVSDAYVSTVDGGYLYYDYVYSELGVRPVINLKADVEFTGNGTIDDPYKIVTE